MTTRVREGKSGRRDRHVRKHLRRNFLAHGIEGGIYIGGMQFLSGAIVLPEMVKSLGGADWMIAASPLVMMAGFHLPVLLTAHLIERLKRLRPALLLVGVFQRLPFLLAAIALWAGAGRAPAVALAAVMLAPLLSGLAGGVINIAWQELVANTIPPDRRSSLWAMRNIISGIIGLGAGAAVYAVLRRWPGSDGYALLHLITFGFVVVSYALFWLIREGPNPRRRPRHAVGLVENLSGMPKLLAADVRLRRYILCTMFGAGFAIMLPRLSLHALNVLDRPNAYLGVLVSIQTAGAIVGNFVAGYVGDRRGGKAAIVLGLSALIAACLGAMVATTVWQFWAVFFVLGGGLFAYQVGRATLNLEVCPLESRVGYLAIIAVCNLVSMFLVVLISWGAWWVSGERFAAVALPAAAALLVSIGFVLRVREPRTDGAGSTQSTS